MARLSRADLEGTLGFLREAEAVTGPDPFPSELLDGLRELVPSDFVSYQQLDQPGRRIVAYESCARGREVDASQPDEEGLARTFWRLIHQVPLWSYPARTGDITAHKLSDFVTRRQWHRLEIYAEYFRLFGVEYKLVLGLPAPPSHTKDPRLLARRQSRLRRARASPAQPAPASPERAGRGSA